MLRVLNYRTDPPSVTTRVVIQNFGHSLSEPLVVPGHSTFDHLSQRNLNTRRGDDGLEMRRVAQLPLAYQGVLLPGNFASIEGGLDLRVEVGVPARSEEIMRCCEVGPKQKINIGVTVLMPTSLPCGNQAG